jgi:hypothetical protein
MGGEKFCSHGELDCYGIAYIEMGLSALKRKKDEIQSGKMKIAMVLWRRSFCPL